MYRILILNSMGEALAWASKEKAAHLYVNDHVMWSVGDESMVLVGGINNNGQVSTLEMNSIIAIKSNRPRNHYKIRRTPKNNKNLFQRDHYICAYCKDMYTYDGLTRDHIVPRSRGGGDVWNNLVTCCVRCNRRKGDRTPDEAGMKLAYVPYIPNYDEQLILRNRNILGDQMDYLVSRVSRGSRFREV